MKVLKHSVKTLLSAFLFAAGSISTIHVQAQSVPELPPRGTNTYNLTSEEITASLTAVEAARQAIYVERFSNWVQRAEIIDGQLATASSIQSARLAKLHHIGTNAIPLAAQELTKVQAFSAATGIPILTQLPDGGQSLIVEIKNGIPVSYVTHNAVAADTSSADEIMPGGATSLSLTGTNVSIGLWDGGDVLINHREFVTNGVRVIDTDGPQTVSSHATHVAGTIAAYGVTTAARGHSHRATVLAGYFGDDLLKIPLVVQTNGLRLSNHSYGIYVGWGGAYTQGGQTYPIWRGDTAISQTEDYHFGFYTSRSADIDNIAYAAATYLPVWSAGNERGNAGLAPTNQPVTHVTFTNEIPIFSNTTRPNDGDAGGFDTLSPQAVAKNVLTIGAVNGITGGYNGSNSVVMSTMSSFGPTDDGRIKPDLVADGVALSSPTSTTTTSYGTMSGTSMSSPAVAGALGLLLELQQLQYTTNNPWIASTFKALAINTTDEAGTAAGPDYRFGWGLLNAARAAGLMTNNASTNINHTSLPHIKEVRLVSGDFIEFPVTSGGTQPLKVTIAWTDPAAAPLAAELDPIDSMLINDLDLRLIRGTNTFLPWILDPVNRNSAATTGDNRRDNVEQVVIQNPTAGDFLVRVIHKRSLLDDTGTTNAQRVSISISGNVVQEPPVLAFNDVDVTSTNRLSFGWESVVGRVYQIKYADDVAASVWLDATGEISATKTNTAADISFDSSHTNRFYRLQQLR